MRRTLGAVLVVALAGCAAHPDQWSGGPAVVPNPMGVASLVNEADLECRREAWSASTLTPIDDRLIDLNVYDACMRGKGFHRR